MADAKRKIDDAGEKIGGARKDWARDRMVKSDVEHMTDAEMVEHVQKDNVWPKPDYAALVQAGMSVEAAAQIKIIRDRIAKAPAISVKRPHATTLAWYFETLSAVGRYLESCKTLDEVIRAYYVLHETISKEGHDRQYYINEGFARFDVIRRGRRNPIYRDFQDQSKVRNLISQGFPDDVPAWRRGFVVKQYPGRSDFIIVKGKYLVGKGFGSEQEALDHLKEAWEAAKANKSSKTTKKTPDRPHLDHIERTGLPDRRGGADVSPQTFIDVFGFRAVEFGEWLPDDERQLVLNHGYDALMDLADAIGFDPGQLSLDGTLAVAFGARGQGGFAAHYESGRRVVNLTRLSGAGSLAHEWGHALDHKLGTGTSVAMEIPSLTGWRTQINDCRNILAHHGEAAANAGQGVLSTIYYQPSTRQDVIDKADANIKDFTASVASYRSAIDKYVARTEAGEVKRSQAHLNKLTRGMASQQKGLDYWERSKADALAKAETDNFGKKTSNYYTEAAKISGSNGYWARPNELFARAFESYVTDSLAEMGATSNYLIAWADSRFYPEELYKGNPYPIGDEREKIRSSFESLMANVVNLIPNRSNMPPIIASEAKRSSEFS